MNDPVLGSIWRRVARWKARSNLTTSGGSSPAAEHESPEQLYLDLLKNCLTRYIFDKSPGFDKEARAAGLDWPADAETMIGLERLSNIQACATSVIQRNIPGDFIEAGVWRGGSTLMMRAVLKAYGDTSRRVWVADSFQGLPRSNERDFPADIGDLHWTYAELSVPQEEVEENFRRYGLLDDQVVFLPGWFKDTLLAAPIEQLSLLRIDADMYESTTEALAALYPKLSPGGYVIVDDYGAILACRQAVDDFRASRKISDRLHKIDWTGIYWECSAKS